MRKSVTGRALAASGMAVDLAKIARSTDEHTKREARRMLAERMGKLRGLPQKWGQSLSLSADEEAGEEFEVLTESAEPLPLEIIETLLESHWGKPWHEVLTEISPKGLAASLGQVHKGRLHDGREVAIKVAYPGIREAVMADLRIMGWLGKAGERVMTGFEMGAYRQVLLTDLEEELDYRLEAQQQIRYRSLVASHTPICVPEVVTELSGESVLVTVWEDAVDIKQAATWPQHLKQEIGNLLARHFLHMFFDHGMIHADPHKGNYGFRLTPQGVTVVLYDYGSVAKFPKKVRHLLLRLILMTASLQGDPMSLMEGLGFKGELLEPLRAKLPALCQVLFEPLVTQGIYPHSEWNRNTRVKQILGEDVWNFRMSGPADMVFLVRGFQGIFYYLDRLNVNVPWKAILDEVLPLHLAEVLAMQLPKIRPGRGFEGLARNLCIRLTERGEQKVRLKFPANAVERLESLMTPEVVASVAAKGISLEALILQARSSGFTPGTLFTLSEGERSLHVWLE